MAGGVVNRDDAFAAYPLSRRFTVRRAAGRSARQVRLLAGTSDWRREVLDRLGAGAIATVGPARLPSASPWPWPPISPSELGSALDPWLGTFEITGAVAPRQPGRRRLSILASRGSERIVLKLGTPGDGLETEAQALRMLSDSPLPGIATPAVIAAGCIVEDTIAFVANEALGLDGQRPAIDEPLATFETDVSERLAGLPKAPGTPSTFIPVHGDLTPWNLRRTTVGLALFDWEAAGWGPPGSDLDNYREACVTLPRSRRIR